MKFKNYIEVQSGIKDSADSPGTLDQVLTSTETGVAWVNPGTISAEAATLVVIECKNTSGATITKGTPVYQTGTVGATDVIEIAPADALISTGKQPAIGLLQTTLNNNGFGKVVITGEFLNFTTDPIDGVTPTTGDKVFLKSGGGLTLTKPTGAENGIQNLGLIGKVSGGNAGSITVSSIMRTNDVPNLPTGKIWVGDGNTIVSDTVFLDEPNGRMGIGTTSPSYKLQVNGTIAVASNIATDAIRLSIDEATTFPGSNTSATRLLNFVGSNAGPNTEIGGIRWLNTDGDSGNYQYHAAGITSHNSGESNDGDLRFFVSSNASADSSTGVIEAMRINPTGNVGIGTTSPALQSAGTGIHLNATTSSELKFTNNTTGITASDGTALVSNGNDFLINNRETGKITLGTSNSVRMTVLSGGNVGIGTTSPLGTLDVRSDASNSVPKIIVGNSTTTYNQTNSGSIVFTEGGAYEHMEITYDGLSNKLLFNSPIDSATGLLTINRGGNVGIGTTSPGDKLEVVGNIKTSGTGNTQVILESGGACVMDLLNAQSEAYLRTTTAHDLHFRTTNLNRMVIKAAGNVGIGTTSPGYPLEISNNAITSLVYQRTGVSANKWGFHSDNNATYWQNVTSGSLLFTLQNGGNVGIGTTSPGVKLDVSDVIRGRNSIRVDGAITGSPYFGLYQGGEEKAYIQYVDSGDNFTMQSDGIITLKTGSTERVRVTNGGNVGIGTTGPNAKLEVQGPNIVSASPVVIKKAKLLDLSLATSAYYGGFAEFWMGRYADVSNHAKSILTISLNDGLYGSNTNADTDVMTLRGDGNVGIGTTGPINKLTVKSGSDNSTPFGVLASDGSYLCYASEVSGSGEFNVASASGVSRIKLRSSGDSYFSQGNVGIGTTGPGAKLDIVGSSLGIRVKKANLSDVLRVYTQGSGIFMDNGNVHISDDLKIGATLLSNQENTDIDSAAAEVVAQVSITDYTAAFFDFVVKKGTNIRSGTVYACHDGTNVEFTETSTNDLGDTSGVTLSVDKTSTNLRLIATVTSDDWSVKSLIRAI